MPPGQIAERRLAIQYDGRKVGWLLLLAMAWLGSPIPIWAGEPLPPPESDRFIFLPIVQRPQPLFTCPQSSIATFGQLSVINPSTVKPPVDNPDLNLALRGYRATDAPLTLVNYNGGTDVNAPQMVGIFAEQRTPDLVGAYQIYDWNLECGEDGCRGDPLTRYPVTLLGLGATPGEAISIPSRRPEIDAGGQKVLVLYAAPTRITFVYLREDTIAVGYTVHMEEICVDPNLVTLYETLHQAGRTTLPALSNGEALGVAFSPEVKIAIRDWGSFLDPRSRKDWWQGQ